MNRLRTLFLPLLLLCVVSSPALPAAATGTGLRIGVAKVDITPTDLIVNATGDGPYEGVHDPIFARTLVFANGSETAAIVTLDMIDFPADMQPLRDRIQRETGIAADHVIVTLSHDHSAPHFSVDWPACLGGNSGCSHPTEMRAYTQSTSDKIVDIVKRAKAGLQPARMGIGTGSVDVNVNRDLYRAPKWGMGFNPLGPSDKTVWVVKFESPQGEPIAILFNYGVHSIVTLGQGMVSGDLAGAAERRIEQRYGDKVVALFTLGAAGDQNPKYPLFPTPKNIDRAMARKAAFDGMEAQGFMLAAEAMRVADEITATITAPRIAAAQNTFTCPAKPEKAAQPASAAALKDGVPIHLSALLIDQIAFVGVSGEVVTNISTHLKKASPLSNTILMTIANGRTGYLSDDASYDLPVFASNGTPAARNCVENGIVDGLVKLIQQHL